MLNQSISLTVITSVKPDRLTKRFRLDNEGNLVKEPGGNMIGGVGQVVELDSLKQFGELICSLKTNQALCYGLPKGAKVGDEIPIVASGIHLDEFDTINRTNQMFEYIKGIPGIVMLDIDAEENSEPIEVEQLHKKICDAVPELKNVEIMSLPSASSFISNEETGEEYNGSRGLRLYFEVNDASRIPEVGETIFKRLWLAGHGYIKVGKAAQLLPRTLIDGTVYQQSRLDFAAGAHCIKPLVQRRGSPTIFSGTSKFLDTKLFVPLTNDEERKYKNLVAFEKQKIKPEAEKVRKQYIDELVSEYPKKEQNAARERIAKACEGGELSVDHLITIIIDGKEKDLTVELLLEESEKYNGVRALDPVEPDYKDRQPVAILNLLEDKPNIHSFAHGGRTFFLKQAEEYAPNDSAPRDIYNRLRITDMGNAERFHKLGSLDTKFVKELGWLKWQENCWKTNEAAVREHYKSVVINGIYDEIAEVASQKRMPDVAELSDWALASEANSKINSSLKCASSMCGINTEIGNLDKNLWLLNVQNGTIDLKTGELLPHDRNDLITKLVPATYDPLAKAPLWEKFLKRIFNDDQVLIAFIKRAMGYSLTGSTQADCWFILHGTGANGKSVFLNSFLSMLGDYAGQSAPNLLMQPKGGFDRHPTELADLFGRRLVVCQESEEGSRLAEASVKRMTTSDRIKARYMCKDFFEFDPTHKLWLATNHVPEIRDTTESTWRRICLIPFEVVIPKEERDTQLLEKLKEEWSGILNWAIEGCLEWQKEGLNPPEKVKKATAEYRQTQDTLSEFFSDCCFFDSKTRARASDLYSIYLEWCKKSGELHKSNKDFSKALIERGLERKSTYAGNFYYGIGLTLDDKGNVTEEYKNKLRRDTCEKNKQTKENVSSIIFEEDDDVIF